VQTKQGLQKLQSKFEKQLRGLLIAVLSVSSFELKRAYSMRRFYNLAFACFLLLAPIQHLQAQAAVNSQEQALDAFIEKAMQDWKQPGLSIVVVKDGKVAYLKGFGIKTLGKPDAVDADTQFGMMSTTKAMTALAIAMLVDEKKIRWDDPVTKYLPWFQMPAPYLTEHVTVRDLLRHNTGLGNADLLWVRGDLSTREILTRVHELKPVYSLRNGFIYHNVMYGVAGEVIAAASGMPWEDFMTARILKPLEMNRSYANLSMVLAANDANRSTAHYEIDGKLRSIRDVPVDPVPAAGASWSTARDMSHWIDFLLSGGEYKNKRLVSEENFRELFTPQALVPVNDFYPSTVLTKPRWTAYGLGWFLQDYRGKFVAMHTGSMDGRTAIIGLLPDDKLGVYVFGNADHIELRHAIMWKVFDLYTDGPVRDWSTELLKVYGDAKAEQTIAQSAAEKTRVANTKPSQALSSYAGTYSHPAWGDLVITQQNGKLILRLGSGAENEGMLEHWHYDSFRARLGDGRNGWNMLQFALAPDGKIASISFDGSDDYRFTKIK
jgi:CubicO group peptidase (beta-lactamase class C family)